MRSRRPLVILVAAVTGFATLAVVPAAPAGADRDGPPAGQLPEALVEATDGDGTVRVLVELDEAARVEGNLSSAAVDEQRDRIDAASSSLVDRVDGNGVDITRRYETIPFVAAEVDGEGLDRLASDPGVLAVVEDVVTTPSLIESTQVIDADLAWADGYEGAGQTVAVLDTGVDRTHPFVDDAIVREACFSANRDCPNGQTVDKGTAAGVPCTFSADCGHGTHVAGIAVGEGGPGGMRGVAPDASLISMNVFSNLGGDAVSYPSDQIAAMEHAYQLRDIYDIAAVNMSLGGGASSTFCDDAVPAETAIIENLRSAGIATAIASGNDGLTTQISFPACISSAISVGSTTDADLLSFFGNAAFFLDLVAPGGVGSGAPDALNITSSIPGGGYDHFAGTSMATPHVAGAFALLGEKAPRDTVGRLLTILQRTGVYIPDVTLLEYPRIRPHDALTWMPDEPPNPGFSDVPTGFPFYVDIAWAAFNEVTDGFDDNTFRPGGTLTRQALVAFLYRLLGSPPGPFPNPGFSDVPTDHPFYTEIAWAKANDITDGFTDGTFRPGAGVPRQALAAFLYRLAGEPDGPFPNPGYSDVSGSHPFRDEIRWAAYSEITQGFSNGTFRPVNLLTRQAAVAFLYRFEPWLITT